MAEYFYVKNVIMNFIQKFLIKVLMKLSTKRLKKDELKAIYHSKDTVCIWVFKTREDRNRFMDETAGMLKDDREKYFESFYD